MNSDLMTIIAALMAGISVACFTIAIAGLLEEVAVEKVDDLGLKPMPIFVKMMIPLAPNMKPLTKMGFFDRSKVQTADLLVQAGYDQILNAEIFISVKLLLTLLGFFMSAACVSMGKPMLALLIPPLLFIYPTSWLRTVKKKRHTEILRALPNVLDLLTLSVQAGKDFLSSLKDILDRRRIDALGEELGKTFQEIQLGKKRPEALKELAGRVKLPELTSVVNAIVQAEEMGVSIGQLLSIQGDQLRNKRFSQAEKLANEAPVKILFPVVFFIFPSVFLVLIGPMILQALKSI